MSRFVLALLISASVAISAPSPASAKTKEHNEKVFCGVNRHGHDPVPLFLRQCQTKPRSSNNHS